MASRAITPTAEDMRRRATKRRLFMMMVPALFAFTLIAATPNTLGGGMRNLSQAAWPDLSFVGKPVDMAPWAYSYRADLAVQKRPEAYFIPRRLERLDRVYRTALHEMSIEDLKSRDYDMPDLLRPLPPKPKGRLQAGLLWTGGLIDYQVELHWPAEAPAPETVEVRVYPSSFGWFGWTVDKVLANPVISEDRRTWTYRSDPTEKMDSSYSARVPAATEMVAVFVGGEAPKGKLAVPTIRVVGPNLGVWKRKDIEIEWGFEAKTRSEDFDARLEPFMAMVGPLAPLAGNDGTVVDGKGWRSRPTERSGRGIVVPLLYAPGSPPGLESRITVWTRAGGFTFRISDLDSGPILIARQGVFIAEAGGGQTASRFARELAAKNLKSVRQMAREHPEASSWDELMQEVRLWTCPQGTGVPQFPSVGEPPMDVQLSDRRWTDAWRAASNQLEGKNMWGALAFEVGRVAHEMDMIGLHEPAEKIYAHFLEAPGAKSDGDYTDGAGALEWATAMRHDMGYSHDGTHASTGRLLFAMAERYFLTGDKEWFLKNRVRLQAAADWIIRQRKLYMKDVPGRKDLFVAGLMPPTMLGDYAMPSSDWHWYYVDDALSLQGIQRFADALMELDPKAGRPYRDEASAFRKDLRRVVEREAALSPVRRGRDGAYHSYLPRMAYARGLTGPELGAPQFPDCDMFMGALPLAEPFAAVEAGDPGMLDTLSLMEEMGTSPAAVGKNEEDRKRKGLATIDAWFWTPFAILPKASHNANIYLLQDDVPNFLRFWMNSYAWVVGSDGRLWEHPNLGNYDVCGAPDNGTAGWFMENFRDLLVMEIGPDLWVARATPRAWLEQGKRIAVKNAPTYFGDLAYEIISDADHGKITARIDVPSRRPLGSVILRLRHPRAARMKSVSVNGKPWKKFNAAEEAITLEGLTGRAVILARY
ncbi:MAG: hypothetical protein ACHQ50_02130 [Fimbriimonadales bacterium]